MTGITPLFPRQAVPSLDLPLAGGGRFRLGETRPENFTLVVFYRGLHCPICGRYLADLQSKLEEFAKRGVDVIVASSDGEERAVEAKANWKLDQLRIAYGLSLDEARKWGLYISSSNGKTSAGVVEPDLFSEPGLFLVRPDGTLYFGTVQTMPFARPNFQEVLQALDFVISKNYPARGEIVDHLKTA
ncbi:MAG: AhpC/TSA family protein [Alphaproteobacteria bacterium]|nr:AhpC/TSA family protein [Alphaproteobacteria bacterium]MBU0798019.1 AhpC/TSA family protein [Alphaproteobacteria bacterium]MBU0888314.1 AhpC/TSA family protein [Alphaproteobacteria bacterium]MBU1814210.1 AhpC/TSA family protein [Alphaproteobacteria bacterium]MBU2090553.1 AhpC/TSA family protein [Alphaproteobacteria bacterium]